MDFGINANFNIGGHPTHADAFQEAFEEIDLAEELGLDTVWLGEMHFNPEPVGAVRAHNRCHLHRNPHQAAPVGMAVQVLPLIHPLRIAEEAATVDQLSEGRFEFGVGRSGNVRAYDIMGIDYGESKRAVPGGAGHHPPGVVRRDLLIRGQVQHHHQRHALPCRTSSLTPRCASPPAATTVSAALAGWGTPSSSGCAPWTWKT